MEETKWRRKPQECDGDYFFNGQIVMTHTIAKELSKGELDDIMKDLWESVKSHNGLDYLQAYEHPEKGTVWIIDQLSASMIKERQDDGESPEDIKNHHHATILRPEEY